MQKNKSYNTQKLYFSSKIYDAMNNISNYSLTIVEAPMGYGKTTAVREYLKQEEFYSIWVNVYDEYAINFWLGLCDAFQELDPASADSLRRLGLPNDNISRQEAMRMIKGIVLAKKTALVIDDYYLIDNTDIHHFLTLLTRNNFPKLHIIITTRLILLEQLDELKLKGFAYHITKETLELESEEIVDYYRSCGIRLKESEANFLYTETEGWISALYLLLLDFVQMTDTDSSLFSDRIGRSVPSIYNLVERFIYMPFSAEIREFMLSMCIFDSFTFEQAEFIWGKPSTADILSEMKAKNAFLTYNNKNKSYHMHNIMTNYLKDALKKKDPEFICKLNCQAGQWHRQAGNYLSSMYFFLEADDYDNLMVTVEMDKGHSISVEIKDQLISVYDKCPKEYKQRHPLAVLIYALCMISFNEMELFSLACSDFVEDMEKNNTLSEEEKRHMMGEFELLLSFTDYNNILAMTEHIKKACSLLTKKADFIDTNGGWTFGSPSILYMFYRKSGALFQDVQNLKDSMPYYYQATDGHGSGAEYIFEAEWHFNMADIKNAEIIAYKAIHVAEIRKQPEILICALFLQTRIALFKGDFPEATALLGKMRECVEKYKMYLLLHTIDMCEGFIYSLLKQKSRIPDWIEKGDFRSSRLYFPAIAFCNIIYGRALLVGGDYLKLLGLSEQLIEASSIFPNLLSHIYTLIYIAAANERIYRPDDATEALEQALDLAIADMLWIPFVENCDFIEATLAILHSNKKYHKAVSVILDIYKSYEKTIGKINSIYFISDKQALTERETDIAILAAEGLSNKEISEKLFISINTVKTQMKTIFEKRCIQSRSQLKDEILQ